MNGKISGGIFSSDSAAAARNSDGALGAALIAAAAGAVALISAPLALLMLSALGARALMRAQPGQLNLAALAGPALAALAVGALLGLAAAIGVLFIWRLFSDAHWSIGEAKRLALAAGRPSETTAKELAHAWTTPLFGLSVVAYTAPHMIAGLPLDLPHLPLWCVIAAGAVAAGAVFDWGLRRAADWRLGELAKAPAGRLLIHHLLFLTAFGMTLDMSAGVVMLAAWRLASAAPLPFSAPRTA
ncbi:MAG: hypothetical protein R3C25_12455 [Hyphomonadaceae bacterium]